MRILLRALNENERLVLEPHLEALRRARQGISAYVQQLAPELMARGDVVFEADAGGWFADVQLPASSPPAAQETEAAGGDG